MRAANSALQLQIRRQWKDWALLAVSLAAASLALRWLNVGFTAQARVLAIVLVATGAGALVLTWPRARYPDAVLLGIAACGLGTFLLSLSAFVLAHDRFFGAPLATNLNRLWWGFGLIAVVSLAGVWRLRHVRRLTESWGDARAVALLLAAATAVWAVTHIGFYDGDTITRGHRIDRVHHVVEYPDELLATGMPQEPFRHRGVELLLIQFQGLLGQTGVWDRVVAYKVVALLFYFVVAYATYALGRYGFGAPRWVSVLGGMACLVFGAIYLPIWQSFDLSRSTYLGFFSAAGAFYHNSTQLLSHGMAATGLSLIGAAWKRKQPLIVAGCALIMVSTFFKPTFILYFIPALLAMVGLLWAARRLTWDLALGWLLLLVGPAAWLAYPRVMQIARVPNEVGFAPFAMAANYVPQNWTWPVLQSRPILALFVVGTSFALPILVAGVLLARVRWTESRPLQRWQAGLTWLADRPFEVLVVVFFGLSIVAGLMLVEPNDLRAGNFTWGTASAYLVALPGMLYLLAWPPIGNARWAGWVLFIWHTLSGIRHLVRYALTGQL